MFRKQRTVINGVELPEEFSGSSIINNVAISPDGKKYAAVVKSGGIITGDIPADGKIKVDDTIITYKKGLLGGVNISSSSIGRSFSNITQVFGGNQCIISTSGSSNRGYEIDQGYDGVTTLKLRGEDSNLLLNNSPDNKIYVQGNVDSEPKLDAGNLNVKGLEGILRMPNNPEIKLDIRMEDGNISGNIYNQGYIKIEDGNISLNLCAPLSVVTSAEDGNVNVKGMVSEGDGVYSPPNTTPVGTLELKTEDGNISINYQAQ